MLEAPHHLPSVLPHPSALCGPVIRPAMPALSVTDIGTHKASRAGHTSAESNVASGTASGAASKTASRHPAKWRCAASGLPILDLPDRSPDLDGRHEKQDSCLPPDLRHLRNAVLICSSGEIMRGHVRRDQFVDRSGKVLVDRLSDVLKGAHFDVAKTKTRLLLEYCHTSWNGLPSGRLPENLHCEKPTGWREDVLRLMTKGWLSFVDAVHEVNLRRSSQGGSGRRYVEDLCGDAAWLLRYRAERNSIEALRRQAEWIDTPPPLGIRIDLLLAARSEWRERAAELGAMASRNDPACMSCIRLFFGLRDWVEADLPGRVVEIMPPRRH